MSDLLTTKSTELLVVSPKSAPKQLAHALVQAAREPSGLSLGMLDKWWEHGTQIQRARLVLSLVRAMKVVDSATQERIADPRWRHAIGAPLWLATFASSRRLQRHSRTPNTLRAIRSDWLIWRRWCKARQQPSFNPSVDHLSAFVDDYGPRHKRATLIRLGTTLVTMHAAAGLPNPLAPPMNKEIWRAATCITRTKSNGESTRATEDRRNLDDRQAQGLTFELLQRVLATLDPESLIDTRDAALLCMAYDMLARQSEVAGARVEHLAFHTDGSAIITIPYSKTDQDGDGAEAYLRAETVRALRRWLGWAQITSGAVFRSLRGFASRPGAEINPDALRALPADRFRHILRKRVSGVGDEDVKSSTFSGHSTRVGAAKDMSEAGLSDSVIAHAGRWRGTAMVMRYTRKQKVREGGMAKLAKQQRAGSGESKAL